MAQARPKWQRDAERVGAELRGLILAEIESVYRGDVPRYIREQFGEHALESIVAIAEANHERAAPSEDFETFCAEMLLRYAVNRSAFRVLTAQTGYQDVEARKRTPASGDESIAIMTRSGSMVFGSAGCLTTERAFCYLPIAGRQVKPAYSRGQIVPARALAQRGDDEARFRLYSGFIPIPGQQVAVPRDGDHLWHTSPLVEVKLRRGDPFDPEDWAQTRSTIYSMSTLNLAFHGDAQDEAMA
jgi:hypothetical protein